MLLFAAALSLLCGLYVAFFGQERQVRGWFLLACVCCACVTAGLWVELNLPEHAFTAARVNMTTAIVLAFAGGTAASSCAARSGIASPSQLLPGWRC